VPASSSVSVRVPVEERLFSLVLALLATKGGLTKQEILSSVQGYRQHYALGGDNSNLERQFERDKDDVRELGVPLEKTDSAGQTGNNQNLRYRIPKGDYDLPRDITFSAKEITLLELAGMVWREQSLSAQSRRALLKLRSLGIESDEPIVGYAPRLRIREGAFEPLSSALERQKIVTFDYLKPGESTPQTRTVAPLALVQHQGRWHLHATDEDAGGNRTFLLSRFVGPVRLTGRSFTPTGEGHADRALNELEQIWCQNVAEIDVVPGTDAATRLGKQVRGSTTTTAMAPITVHYTDMNVFAAELASYGPEIVVRAPTPLRDAVQRRLEKIRADHERPHDG